MQIYHFEIALVAVILAGLLVLASKYVGRTVVVLIFVACMAALFIGSPAAVGFLTDTYNYAYNLAMGALH